MANWLRLLLARVLWAWQAKHGGGGGRHTDWAPARCSECGWAGPTRWLVHDYQDDGSGEDVEPVDYCPGCGGSHLEEEYS